MSYIDTVKLHVSSYLCTFGFQINIKPAIKFIIQLAPIEFDLHFI